MNIRRVVCAAIRGQDKTFILGIRHYSMDMWLQIDQMRPDRIANYENRVGDDQGFVDQFGEYITRQEAYVVALNAKQIIRPEACRTENGTPMLYSEAMY